MRKLNMEGSVLIQGQPLKKGPRPGEPKTSAKQKEKDYVGLLLRDR
jgi:hypothetical protein